MDKPLDSETFVLSKKLPSFLRVVFIDHHK